MKETNTCADMNEETSNPNIPCGPPVVGPLVPGDVTQDYPESISEAGSAEKPKVNTMVLTEETVEDNSQGPRNIVYKDPRLSELAVSAQQALGALQEHLEACGLPAGAVKRSSPTLGSPQEFAQRTGFSVHTIRDWCEQGLLPAYKIGNRWRLDLDEAIMHMKKFNRRPRRRRHAQTTQ